jgi:chemotaxis protein CheD
VSVSLRSGTTSGLKAQEKILHVVQGEHKISSDPNLVMVTLLGSCVAACLRDPIAGIGGMNHFLLPGREEGQIGGEEERHAVHAMELLVNALLAKGASRRRLEAKIFGGACTMYGVADVGSKNAAFATAFLGREGIPIVSECLGGRSGRRVQYWPVDGRARRSFMPYETSSIETTAQPVAVSPKAGLLELF